MRLPVCEPVRDADRAWVREFVIARWGAETAVGHGVVYRPDTLPGFIAVVDEERVGLITYHVAEGECEVVTIDSTRPDQGIGTTLIAAVVAEAGLAGCRRVWLVTTNDNLHALRFYTEARLRPGGSASRRRGSLTPAQAANTAEWR